MGPGICLTGMDCSLIQELARKELTMRLLCNASNQLAILSRIAIVIQFILIVSIVASIGITWLWVNCAVVLGWCHAVLINCPGIDRLLIELTNRNGLHKDWWIVQGFMGMFRNRATLLQSSGLWKIASDLGIDSKSSCIVSGLQKNGTIHNTGRTFGEMVADFSWIQEWACNPHNFYAVLSIILQSFPYLQFWCNSNLLCQAFQDRVPIVNWLKNDLDPMREELFFAFGLQSTQFLCNAFN